jgi:hypothetical protein
MPEVTNRKIVNLCRELNQGIGLSETVFKFPLHIFLKKSFHTQRFFRYLLGGTPRCLVQNRLK